jgi:hypothetical protein
MATLDITSWEFEALNPDGTANTMIASVVGANPSDPSTDVVDFAAMSQRVRLTLTCEIAGSITGPSVQASVKNAVIRYAPAMFGAYFGIFSPARTFPAAGYSIQIPETYGSSYQMSLIGLGPTMLSNENGTVIINLIDDQNFTIVHDFYMTYDIEGFQISRLLENVFRFTKTNAYNQEENNFDRQSVYGTLRGLNVYVAMNQLSQEIIAPDLSIPIKASFNGFDPDLNPDFPASYEVELEYDPGNPRQGLTAWGFQTVTVDIADPGAEVVTDECEISLVLRAEQVSTFVRDFRTVQQKLVSTGSTAQINGPIYGPVTYAHNSGVTTITFRVNGSLLSPLENYQLHGRWLVEPGPSVFKMRHGMSGVLRTGEEAEGIDFDMRSLLWTRNGDNGEDFTVDPNQRVVATCEVNVSQYNANAEAPFGNLLGDLRLIRFQIFDEDENLLLFTSASAAGGVIFPAPIINHELESTPSGTILRLWVNEFRVPFTNFQNLPDWVNKVRTVRWSLLIVPQANPEFSATYFQDTILRVGQYENQDPSPKITNFRLFNVDTGEAIASLCGLSRVRIAADINGIADNVYVSVMVDRQPLGVEPYNDYALEEQDPATHPLPPYVIFTQKSTDLVEQLDAQPTSGSIAFVLNLDQIGDIGQYRVFLEAYTAP